MISRLEVEHDLPPGLLELIAAGHLRLLGKATCIGTLRDHTVACIPSSDEPAPITCVCQVRDLW